MEFDDVVVVFTMLVRRGPDAELWSVSRIKL
jgi:hypothetical protein